MSERVLPEGWVDTTLGQIVEYGKAEKATREQVDDNTWVLELEDIEKSSSRVIQRLNFKERQFKSTKNRFKKGDVLYGKLRPYLDKVVIAERDGVCTTEIVPLDARPHLDNRYLFYWLKSLDFLSYVNEVGYGVNMPRLGTKEGKGAPFVLAPKAEQKVIADKLDELLAQVNNLKARLDAIPAILKRFRQSVLAAAVRGELTNGQAENWSEVEFSELLEAIRSGSADKPVDDPSGVPILRSSAVRSREVDFDDVRYLSRSADLRADNYLRVGDLLFTRLSGSAEYVGNCALVNHVGRDCQYPDRLFCARLKDKRMSRYLEVFFSSESFRRHIYASLKSSAGHQRITLDSVRKAIVHLPPLEEQEDIVHRVDQLFAFADQIEQQVSNAQARVDKLTQSILAKAFRGELTAEWRAENPELISGEHSAEALLARIKAEKAKQKPAGRGRKKAAAEAAG